MRRTASGSGVDTERLHKPRGIEPECGATGLTRMSSRWRQFNLLERVRRGTPPRK